MMLMELILIVELLSVFQCIHLICAKPCKVNSAGIVTYVVMFVLMILINRLHLNGLWSVLTYMFLVAYCLFQLKEKIGDALISVLLMLVVLAVIQFFLMMVLTGIAMENLNLRNLIADLGTFLLVKFVLPHCKIDKVKKAICCRHWLTGLIFVFTVVVLFLAFLVVKTTESIDIGFFIFGIPACGIILFLLAFWNKEQDAHKQMEKELNLMETMQKNYEELLERVRINQHGFKNQLQVVMSAHYTCKTYDELVETQQAYCGVMEETNKYNSLLAIGNSTLCGFLYVKLLELEKKGIIVTYKVECDVDSCKMPGYDLVEVLGILLDNAAEALQESEDKNIFIGIGKDADWYVFTVRNIYSEVKYEEIFKWFQEGYTTKGTGRGIGLYQARELCLKWNSMIQFDNIENEEKNWIEFKLKVPKKEDGV